MPLRVSAHSSRLCAASAQLLLCSLFQGTLQEASRALLPLCSHGWCLCLFFACFFSICFLSLRAHIGCMALIPLQSLVRAASQKARFFQEKPLLLRI